MEEHLGHVYIDPSPTRRVVKHMEQLNLLHPSWPLAFTPSIESGEASPQHVDALG